MKYLIPLVYLASSALAFAPYQSLAGLSNEEIDKIIPTLRIRDAQPIPPREQDTSAKLVNDQYHPWKPLRPGDQRGPCPGLNTLASHGYLDRSGIVTPGDIVTAVQQGFNMDHDIAVFVTYAAMLVDGNQLTNLLSIGDKSSRTGPDPPAPATVAGLDTHLVFEGDTSLTRGDAFFGDNHSFNETLFQEMVSFANQFGGGKYNKTAAAEFKFHRIQASNATNPQFNFLSPRTFTTYAEAVFPYKFFVDGRVGDDQLDMTVARGFFQNSSMPDGFFRRNGTFGGNNDPSTDIGDLFLAHPTGAGVNQGLGNWVEDPNSPTLNTINGTCVLYHQYVNGTIRSLYPNPTGALRKALNVNLNNFFQPLSGFCEQIFPYGKD